MKRIRLEAYVDQVTTASLIWIYIEN